MSLLDLDKRLQCYQVAIETYIEGSNEHMSTYCKLENFGDHFNLVIWQFRSQSPNLKFGNN